MKREDNEDTIMLVYRSTYDAKRVKKFQTLRAARKFAQRMMGDDVEITDERHAISRDGQLSLACAGAASMREIFPQEEDLDDICGRLGVDACSLMPKKLTR